MRPALFLLLLSSLVRAQSRGVAVDVPAGWTDVTSSKKSPDILAALKGPEKSSFSLTRLASPPTNRAAARAFLLDILRQIGRKTKLEFSEPGTLKSQTFKNGLSAEYIQVELKSSPAAARPKMVLAIADYRGTPMVATLMSAIPDILLAPILGSVSLSGAPPAAAPSGHALSSDSQLDLLLPAGTVLRELSPHEAAHGIVLALKAPDAQLWIKKVDEAGTNSREETQNVVKTILAIPGVERASLSPVRAAASPAGPAVIYLSAAVNDSSGRTNLAAGFLPWGAWSYSLFAKGPGASGLLERSVAGLAMGSAADVKGVAASPRLSAAGGPGGKALFAAVAAAALALALAKRYTRK